MGIVDQLVTIFTLNASGYVKGANTVIQYSRNMQRAMAFAQRAQAFGGNSTATGRFWNMLAGGARLGALSSLFSGLSSVVSTITSVISATERLIETAARMSFSAMEESASFDAITRSMTGYYRSQQAAQQMMSYLDQYAMHSRYHLKELAKGALELSAAGLDVNRFLPIAEKLSVALGEASPENLEKIVGVLRRIKGGQITKGMGPTGLGRFGISRDELERYGAQFDNAGRFKGSANEAFNVIEKLVIDRLSAVADNVAKGYAVTISNAGDAYQRVVRKIGDELNRTFLPTVRDATDALNELSQAGIISDVGEAIAHSFDIDITNSDMMEGMIKILAMAEAIAQVINNWVSGADELWNNSPLGRVLHTLPGMNDPKEVDYDNLAMDAFGINTYRSAVERMTRDLDIDRDRRKKGKGKKGGAPGEAPHLPDEDDLDSVSTAIDNNRLLSKIETNTKNIYDLQRHILGGGDAGRYGVTPLEIGAMKRPSYTGAPRKGALRISEAIEQAILHAAREMLGDTILNMGRAGLI